MDIRFSLIDEDLFDCTLNRSTVVRQGQWNWSHDGNFYARRGDLISPAALGTLDFPRPSGHALVAQRIEHLTTDQKVGGSNPFERAHGPRRPAGLPGVAFFMTSRRLGGGSATLFRRGYVARTPPGRELRC